jgi:hypothetical protein
MHRRCTRRAHPADSKGDKHRKDMSRGARQSGAIKLNGIECYPVTDHASSSCTEVGLAARHCRHGHVLFSISVMFSDDAVKRVVSAFVEGNCRPSDRPSVVQGRIRSSLLTLSSPPSLVSPPHAGHCRRLSWHCSCVRTGNSRSGPGDRSRGRCTWPSARWDRRNHRRFAERRSASCRDEEINEMGQTE